MKDSALITNPFIALINEVFGEAEKAFAKAEQEKEACEPCETTDRPSDLGGFYIENGELIVKMLDPKRVAAAIMQRKIELDNELKRLRLFPGSYSHDHTNHILRDLQDLIRLANIVRPDFN